MEMVGEKVVLSDKEFSDLDKMLNGIAWKYNGWSGLQQEDIYMELWIKALEVIKSMGKIEMNLLAMCSYNRAIDLCRSAKKQNERYFNASDLLEVFGNTDEAGSGQTFSCCTEDDHSSINIQDMINLFDPGTKERKYIILVALYLGLDESVYGESKSKMLFGNDRMELELAHLLGYVNDTSNGYRRLRGRVREKLVEQGFKILKD